MRPRLFENIVVHPTQNILRPPFMLFRGGPEWPRFWLQGSVRHCRYRLGVPLDHKPRAATEAVSAREAAGIWCGPVSEHFGHALTDFAGRLAYSSQFGGAMPLIFSAEARTEKAPPPFFFELLEHFAVPPERVIIVTRPTRFDRLHVFPQAERLFGGPPSREYLALLDRVVTTPPATTDGSRLFVSRAGLAKGRLAGEAYLETVLARAGFETFRPETVPLAEQLGRYRRADHLVFSEGSAIHALQLLGSVPAKITVIRRRARHRIAAAVLKPRVRSIDYIDCLRGTIHGARPQGGAQISSGISILDERRCVERFARGGIDIADFWDEQAYAAHRDRDIIDWIGFRRQRPRPPVEQRLIRRGLARAGIAPAIIATLDP